MKTINVYSLIEYNVSQFGSGNSCGILEMENIGDFIYDCFDNEIPVPKAVNSLYEYIEEEKREESRAFVMISILPPTKKNKKNELMSEEVSNYFNNFIKKLKKHTAACTRPRTNPNTGNQINVMIF